jgi:hypothetical protein
MDQVQQFTGLGTIYRSDGSTLPGERRYSVTLVPSYQPARPLAIGSSLELHDHEPLDLENEPLTVELADGRWFTFRIINVSETPPHPHTLIAQDWPSEQAAPRTAYAS